jgi:hypothetical protein
LTFSGLVFPEISYRVYSILIILINQYGVLVHMISDTSFVSLRGASIHRGDEAILVDLVGNEIATP